MIQMMLRRLGNTLSLRGKLFWSLLETADAFAWVGENSFLLQILSFRPIRALFDLHSSRQCTRASTSAAMTGVYVCEPCMKAGSAQARPGNNKFIT